MKSRFLILLITLLSFLICSCKTLVLPKNLGSYGSTLEETIENFNKRKVEEFAKTDVGYELKDFYGAYYISDFEKLSKYEIVKKEYPEYYMYEMGLTLCDEEVLYDDFIEKYIEDYYLMGVLLVRYEFIVYDSLGNKYLVKVAHLYNNCFTSIDIDKNDFIQERELYILNNEKENLLNLEYLINYKDSEETFKKIKICDSNYYMTNKDKKVLISDTSVIITPINDNGNGAFKDSIFKYKDLIYLYSNEYDKSPIYEPMEKIFKEFYSEIVMSYNKKEICVEK